MKKLLTVAVLAISSAVVFGQGIFRGTHIGDGTQLTNNQAGALPSPANNGTNLLASIAQVATMLSGNSVSGGTNAFGWMALSNKGDAYPNGTAVVVTNWDLLITTNGITGDKIGGTMTNAIAGFYRVDFSVAFSSASSTWNNFRVAVSTNGIEQFPFINSGQAGSTGISSLAGSVTIYLLANTAVSIRVDTTTAGQGTQPYNSMWAISSVPPTGGGGLGGSVAFATTAGNLSGGTITMPDGFVTNITDVAMVIPWPMSSTIRQRYQTTNTCYVFTNGNDSTAVVGDLTHPFASWTNALSFVPQNGVLWFGAGAFSNWGTGQLVLPVVQMTWVGQQDTWVGQGLIKALSVRTNLTIIGGNWNLKLSNGADNQTITARYCRFFPDASISQNLDWYTSFAPTGNNRNLFCDHVQAFGVFDTINSTSTNSALTMMNSWMICYATNNNSHRSVQWGTNGYIQIKDSVLVSVGCTSGDSTGDTNTCVILHGCVATFDNTLFVHGQSTYDAGLAVDARDGAKVQPVRIDPSEAPYFTADASSFVDRNNRDLPIRMNGAPILTTNVNIMSSAILVQETYNHFFLGWTNQAVSGLGGTNLCTITWPICRWTNLLGATWGPEVWGSWTNNQTSANGVGAGKLYHVANSNSITFYIGPGGVTSAAANGIGIDISWP